MNLANYTLHSHQLMAFSFNSIPKSFCIEDKKVHLSPNELTDQQGDDCVGDEEQGNEGKKDELI